MELNIAIDKFGTESKKIVNQIKQWGDKKEFDDYLARYFNSFYKNRAAFAFVCEGEVVAYALVEQMYNSEEQQGQCTIRDVVINPDALHSGLEEYVVESIVRNRDHMLARKNPTLFVGFAPKENAALLTAYELNGFEVSHQNDDTLVLTKNNEPQKERE